MLVLAAPTNDVLQNWHLWEDDNDGDEVERPNCFVYTVPGELVVTPPLVCDSGRAGHCGCAEAWTGVGSGKGTTVAVIREQDITQDQYIGIVSAYLTGHVNAWEPGLAREQARFLAELAADYPTGTLVRMQPSKNGDWHEFQALEPEDG